MALIRFPWPAVPSWAARAACSSRNAWSGALLGVSIAALADLTVLRAILGWEHVDGRGSVELGSGPDAFLEIACWLAAITGAFLLIDVTRLRGLWWKRWAGGLLLGAGAFQFVQAAIQPRLLNLQEAPYFDGMLPYHLLWTGVAIGLAAAGITVLRATGRAAAEAHGDGPARTAQS